MSVANAEMQSTAAARILIVDDEPDLLHLMDLRLNSAGYHVLSATSGEAALALFQAMRPHLVLTDLRMAEMDGHALFARLQQIAPSVPVIMLTAHGKIPDAITATRNGMFGFLSKSITGKELLRQVAAALAVSPRIDAVSESARWRSGVIAVSLAMEEVLRQAWHQASSDAPLLLLGQRGTGKEVLARAIWQAGAQAKQPFLTVRCTAPWANVPVSASTDSARWAYLVERTADGVMYLDDLCDLPPSAQALVMQSMADGTWPGGKNARVRMIASAGPDIERQVRAGVLRSDLYYAFFANAISLPALAERREDIPELVSHMLREAGETRHLAPAALQLLKEAAWPGNVRQLQSVVLQSARLSVSAPLIPQAIVARVLGEENQRELAVFDEARRAFEYDYLVSLLDATHGNVARAARVAGRNRSDFYKLLARHQLDPVMFKSAR